MKTTKLFLSALIASFSVVSFSAHAIEIVYEGIQMKAGDQKFIGGHAVSCEAPLPTEAQFTLKCKVWEPTFKITENTFVAKFPANQKDLWKKADQIVIENNIDPNAECKLFGPEIVKETK